MPETAQVAIPQPIIDFLRQLVSDAVTQLITGLLQLVREYLEHHGLGELLTLLGRLQKA